MCDVCEGLNYAAFLRNRCRDARPELELYVDHGLGEVLRASTELMSSPMSCVREVDVSPEELRRLDRCFLRKPLISHTGIGSRVARYRVCGSLFSLYPHLLHALKH